MNSLENLKDLIIYQSQNNENISVEVLYNEEDFWLTQKSMGKLFGVEVNTINYHLKEIFETNELKENRTIRKIRTVQKEGNRAVSRDVTWFWPTYYKYKKIKRKLKNYWQILLFLI